MSLETIYMLQVSKEILSPKLLDHMIYMAEYVHRNLKFNECIVSVHELTTLHENESDLEIIEEVQKIIKELEAEIAAQRDSEFDGLASYDYIQFI